MTHTKTKTMCVWNHRSQLRSIRSGTGKVVLANWLISPFKNDYREAKYKINTWRWTSLWHLLRSEVVCMCRIAGFKVKATDPLSGEPVCLPLTFSFFSSSFLAHVVSLSSSALRLWWVKEMLCFTFCLMALVSHTAIVAIAAKRFDWLSVKFSYMRLQKFCTYKYQVLFNCVLNTRKIDFFLWMLSTGWGLQSERLFLRMLF